jgi:hypothetical protein
MPPFLEKICFFWRFFQYSLLTFICIARIIELCSKCKESKEHIMNENKTINIVFRVSPRYKEYLVRLANRAKYNSISEYLNSLIFFETMGMIQEMAWEESKKIAAKAIGIPETVGLTIDRENAKSVLGDERALKFLEIIIKEHPTAVERIKSELQFIDNDYEYIVNEI